MGSLLYISAPQLHEAEPECGQVKNAAHMLKWTSKKKKRRRWQREGMRVDLDRPRLLQNGSGFRGGHEGSIMYIIEEKDEP